MILSPQEQAELIELAHQARARAYAPYSRFHVGAVVVTPQGRYTGANVENASYGLCICAERSAVATAMSAGARTLSCVVVATGASPPASPCGMCRQVLLEFAPEPAQVLVLAVNDAGEARQWTLAELIPDGFSGAELARSTP